MLRLHSRCTPNVIGGYNGGKMIRSLQFTQHVPTGFQVPSPPVLVVAQAREIANLKLRVCRCAEKRSGSPGSSKEVAIEVEDSEIEYADDGRAVESPDEYHTPPIAHAVAELALAEEVNQVQAEILPIREPVQVRSTFASVFQPTLMSAILDCHQRRCDSFRGRGRVHSIRGRPPR